MLSPSICRTSEENVWYEYAVEPVPARQDYNLRLNCLRNQFSLMSYLKTLTSSHCIWHHVWRAEVSMTRRCVCPPKCVVTPITPVCYHKVQESFYKMKGLLLKMVCWEKCCRVQVVPLFCLFVKDEIIVFLKRRWSFFPQILHRHKVM